MRKVVKTLVVLLFAIAVLRSVVGTGGNLRLSSVLSKVREKGNFYTFDDVWLDVQALRFSVDSLSNSLKASAGSEYVTYEVVRSPGRYVSAYDLIYRTDGTVYATVFSRTYTKPSTGNVLEWIMYIGNFLNYVGNVFRWIGFIIFDTLKSFVQLLYRLFYFAYYLIFT